MRLCFFRCDVISSLIIDYSTLLSRDVRLTVTGLYFSTLHFSYFLNIGIVS